jgi:hypothetical protein
MMAAITLEQVSCFLSQLSFELPVASNQDDNSVKSIIIISPIKNAKGKTTLMFCMGVKRIFESRIQITSLRKKYPGEYFNLRRKT